MATSVLKNVAIIIEPNWREVEKVKITLGRLKKKKIIVINIHCLSDKFLKIKELISNLNDGYLKIFHKGKEENFNNMISTFSLHGRSDIVYRDSLDSRSIADCYNEYIYKSIPVTFSMREGTRFQKIFWMRRKKKKRVVFKFQTPPLLKMFKS